jgi:glycerol-3-phosphate dehydrogenase (NAD(P)+)
VGGLSRNRSLGIALAQGKTVAEVEGASRMVAEGVRTVTSALALARRHGVSMPICSEVAAVLFEAKAPSAALASLLGRAATREDA